GVLVVDAVVADHRRGESDDLTEIGGIGDDLLITGHGRIEDALAGDGGVGAKGAAVVDGTVFEGEEGGLRGGHGEGGRKCAPSSLPRVLWKPVVLDEGSFPRTATFWCQRSAFITRRRFDRETQAF